MNLSQTTLHTIPFNHWELSDCLDDLTLNEIVNATVTAAIPELGIATATAIIRHRRGI